MEASGHRCSCRKCLRHSPKKKKRKKEVKFTEFQAAAFHLTQEQGTDKRVQLTAPCVVLGQVPGGADEETGSGQERMLVPAWWLEKVAPGRGCGGHGGHSVRQAWGRCGVRKRLGGKPRAQVREGT